jgi:hypothetical protein
MAKPVFTPVIEGNFDFDPPPPSPTEIPFMTVRFSGDQLDRLLVQAADSERRAGILLKPHREGNSNTLKAERVIWGIDSIYAPKRDFSVTLEVGTSDGTTPNPSEYPKLPKYDFAYFDVAELSALRKIFNVKELAFRRTILKMADIQIKMDGVLQNYMETLVAEPFPNNFKEIFASGEMHSDELLGQQVISFAIGYICPPVWPPNWWAQFEGVIQNKEVGIASSTQKSVRKYYAKSLKRFSTRRKIKQN